MRGHGRGLTTTSAQQKMAYNRKRVPQMFCFPPNADVGSVAKAAWYASVIRSATATPHGFACLTITQAGAVKACTHSSAESVSATLL